MGSEVFRDKAIRGSALPLTWLGFLALLTLGSWTLGERWRVDIERDALAEALLWDARGVALALRPETVVRAMGESNAEEARARLQEQLRYWRGFFPGRALLLVGRDLDGGLVRLADGEVESDRVDWRTLLPADLDAWTNFAAGKPEGVAPSKGGRYVVAVAPIRFPAGGPPLAVVAACRSLEDWNLALGRARWQARRIALLLTFIVFLASAILWWRFKEVSPSPRGLRWHPEVLLIAAFGIVLLWAVGNLTRGLETRMEVLQARERADDVATVIRGTLRSIEWSLEGIQRFFAGSEQVTSEEFYEYTKPIVRKYPIEFIARLVSRGEAGGSTWTVTDCVSADPTATPEVGKAVAGDSGTLALWLERLKTGVPDAVHGVVPSEGPDRLLLGGSVRASRPTAPGREAVPPGYEVVLAQVDLQRLFQSLRMPPGSTHGSIVIEVAEPERTNDAVGPETARADRPGASRAFLVPIGVADVPLTLTIRASLGPRPGLSLTDVAMGGSVALFILATLFVGWIQRYEQRLEHEVAARTKELRASQEELQVTLDSIQDAVIATGPDGRITLMNPAAEKLTGWSTPTAKNLPSEDVVNLHDGNGGAVVSPARTALGERRAVQHSSETLILMSRDGATHYVEASASPIRDSSGEVVGSVLLLRDVSDTYAFQQQLRESERRFRLLFEGMLDGCAVFDVQLDPSGTPVDYRFVAVNPTFERMVGRPASEVLGRSLRDVFPDAYFKWVEALQHVAQGGTPEEFETHDSPSRQYFVVRAYLLEPQRLAMVMMDITDRKRAEEELLRSQQLLRDIVETIQDGVALLDRDLTVRYLNSAMRRWYEDGRDPIGRKCHDVFHHRAEPCDPCPSLRCLTSGRTEHEIVPGRGDREVEWLELFTYPMRDPVTGNVIGVVEFVRDVTALRKAEEERRRMEERMLAVQRLESLGVLAGGIAHDFNNILMAILGNADLAKHELPLGSPAREYIIHIEVASRRAAELCRQMLAYAGQGRYVVEVIDLNELISEMVQLLTASISKRVRLNLQLEPGIPPIRGDASQIRQVVMNLVVNASEAIGDRSGTISINTGAVECDRRYLAECALDQELSEGLYVKLEVADTGCGMDKATMAKIFDPFFTTKFTGRGLGLSAVLGIVRGHKGAIRVYSEPGKGSVFKLLFPACLDGVPKRMSEPAEQICCGGGLVLLVDDDESVRALGKRMLERLGFEVVVGSDGRQAIELFHQYRDRIRLIVLDLTMPGMGGEDVFRAIRAEQPDARVVLASGYSADELASRLSAKGYAGFLQKPYTMDDLARVLKSVLA